MDRTPKEILALARARFDERHFAGSFDKVGAYVEDGASDPDIARVLSMERAIAKGEAEASIKELLRAIPGIVAPPDASDWFALRSAPIPPDRVAMERPMRKLAKAGDRGGLVEFADMAMANLDAMQGPGPDAIAVKAVLLDTGTVNLVPLEPMGTMRAMTLMEGGLGSASQRSVAICTILDLRDAVREEFAMHAAKTFGRTIAPARLSVCFSGHHEGDRIALAEPMGDAAGRRVVDARILDVIKAAYATEG